MAVESKQKMGFITSSALIFAALIFDLFSIIPFLNIVVNIVAWIFFSFIFMLKGISYSKHLLILPIIGTSFIIGIIPGFSALPETTGAIIAILTIIRIEEKLGSQKN